MTVDLSVEQPTDVTSPAPWSTMISTREVPWMKLGKLTDTAMTAKEAAVLGGLNFAVEKRELYFNEPKDAVGIKKVDDRVAVVRSDNSQCLGIMSKDYALLQYSEAFDFMDSVNPTYVAAGALKGGKQGFMVVKAPETISVMDGEDPHELFMVLRTSHDGSRAIEVSVMPLRGRCMNQLTLRSFTTNVKERWAIKHTSTMHAKLADAKASLENMGAYAQRFETIAHRLIDLKVNDLQAQSLLTAVLPDRPKRGEQIEKIITSWHQSPTVGFDFTGWGLVNAVSEYFDWGRSGGSPESRFIGALQGQTHNAINRLTGRLLTQVG